MKTRIIFFLLLLSVSMAVKANSVGEKQAREIGAKFLNGTMKMPVVNADALRLVKTYRCATGEEAFFLFNTNTGFVIVAADDCVTPIIGYSYEGPFDVDNIPVQLQDYLNGFLKQIEFDVANHIDANETVATQWHCVQAMGKIHADRSKGHIDPLLIEKWGQGNPYNRYCPEDPVGSGNHVVTGCAATAMAQIMHYWRYPEHGQGSHSYTPYTHPEYGVQSVDFSAATYRWDQMPNRLSELSSMPSSDEEIDAVATLMYHCGVSVDMDYAPGGSGAYPNDVPLSLVQYFRYSEDLQYIHRQQDDAEWLASIKACLDLYRPVFYSGQGPEGGHAFVCDGYDEDDLLHFNWGWSGNGNGFFALNDIEYNSDNSAIVNIHAPSDPNQICQVIANANASSVGTVLGGGDYHHGDICTLAAQASSGCKFRAWLEDGVIVWQEPEYTFLVVGDRHVEAFFDGEWTAQVEAGRVDDHGLHTQSAVVSWVNGSPVSGDIHNEWPMLTYFYYPQNGSIGVATDGNYIYTAPWGLEQDSMFCKFDFAGNLLDAFNIEGGGRVYDLAFDGHYYYGSRYDTLLYCYDLVNKTLVDVIPTPYSSFRCCTYDPDRDGFWVNLNYSSLQLIGRNGEVLQESPPLLSDYGTVENATYYKNDQGEPHLLFNDYEGEVYDFDINANVASEDTLCHFLGTGSFIGEYMGKTALYGVEGYGHGYMYVYELPLDLSQVQLHRIYRVEGVVGKQGPLLDPELIADRRFGSSYTDLAFDTLPSGTYTYGVSLLTNGLESEIHWSNPIEHINHYAISASVNVEEGGTVTGQGIYWEGEECTLTATANSNYIFTGWLQNGNVVSTETVYSFTVTEDAEYEARFEQASIEIQVLISPQGSAEVTGAGTYNKGETVTLVVTPESGYRFSQWTENGAVLSVETTYSFVATIDRIIYANMVNNHGVGEHGEEGFTFHPNPVTDHLVVECSQSVRRCEVFSVSGVLMYSKDEINELDVEIGVGDLPSGVYMIRVVTDGCSLIERFVKQ